MFKTNLPYIGECYVTKDKKEPNHYLWLSGFGWHDCTKAEDKIIKNAIIANKRS